MQRYGNPTGNGIKISAQATFDNIKNPGSIDTPSGDIKVKPSNRCLPYGAKIDGFKYFCDYFGLQTINNSTKINYNCLLETSPTSPDLLNIVSNVPKSEFTINFSPVAIQSATQAIARELLSYQGSTDINSDGVVTSVSTAPVLSLLPVSLVNGSVGTQYPDTLITAIGGVPSYNVSVSDLPIGLSFDGKKITGTPALGSNGIYTVLVSVNDSNSQTLNTNLTLTITPPPAIVLGTSNLPTSGKLAYPYNGSVSATGGIGELIWSADGLPTGLTISASGIISGSPKVPGIYTPIFLVQDSIGQKLSGGSATITIKVPLVINSHIVPLTANKGIAYTGRLQASGGFANLVWTASGLPSGLNISCTGIITGAPLVIGNYQASFTVTDGLGTVAMYSANIIVKEINGVRL